MSTTTLSMGRVRTPRRAIASQTRMPARSRRSNGSRVRQSFTSSTPATRPTWRMSPTLGAELVGGEAVSVKESLELLVLAQEGLEHLPGGERGGHREVAASQSFCDRQEIRLHAF